MSTDHDCSRILEKVLRLSSPYHVRVFFHRLVGHFYHLFTHRFGSHVLQTLISLIPKAINDKDSNDGAEEELPTLQVMVVNMCQELMPLMPQLMADTYGSHLLRLLLPILAGVNQVSDEQVRSKGSRQYQDKHDSQRQQAISLDNFKPPKEFEATFNEIVLALTERTQMRLYATNKVASPLLQCLLKLLHEKQSSNNDDFIKSLLDISADNEGNINDLRRTMDFFCTLCEDVSGSHLIQLIGQLGSDHIFDLLFSNFVVPRIPDMAMSKISNYVLQTMFENCRSGNHVEMAINGIRKSFDQCLFRGRANVIVKLLEAASKHSHMEPQLFEMVLKSIVGEQIVKQLHDGEISEELKSQIFKMLAQLQKNSRSDQQFSINPSSASLVASMMTLKLQDPYFNLIPSAIVAQPIETIESMARDQAGSRILESLLMSTTSSMKTKRQLTKTFLANPEVLFSLACDKFGSHVIDKCWGCASDLTLKEQMAKEFNNRREELASNFYGRLVLRNCNIRAFAQKKNY